MYEGVTPDPESHPARQVQSVTRGHASHSRRRSW
ncbi:hypothetical protein Krac_0088 [Ktedonobacter racemifer DSM 44963]|uniref:Uncharacterized protein n=1 Tax=Ktedonobacter racemifer DSM 44963 TaxID=485913 RepID=D6U8Q0_KTERA|nr:hypothetical protein Krac_0088 [Ktedonobacter racemifer DSM 44963]